MDECVFCNTSLTSGSETVILTAKGCAGIIKASEDRGSDIHVIPGQQVHTECRRNYTNPKSIASAKRKSDATESCDQRHNLRSTEPTFSYKEQCLFCGVGDKYGGRKKLHVLIPVRTMDFHTSIRMACDERGSDQWSECVIPRLDFAKDLHAADAVYHKLCSTNFRTNRQIPQCFVPDSDDGSSKKQRLGRQTDSERESAFLYVMDQFEARDEEQTTLNDLIVEMAEALGPDCEPYSNPHMKTMLQKHFRDNVIITDINGIENVVTFRRKAVTILSDFFKQPKQQDSELETVRIVEATANLIKSDIKCITQSKDVYPTTCEMSSVSEATSFLPNSLKHLLDILFVGKDKELKIASIGQAIMQATRPRVLIAPLQIGLGVQMHSHFASRFLIDTLHHHGFSCSYSEVQTYERNAAINTGIDIPGYVPGRFMQYIADNVDHNIRTLDGTGTFHGMGIINTITPKINHSSLIKRVVVSAEDIAAVGRICIKNFAPHHDGMAKLKYEHYQSVTDKDRSTQIDLLWKVTFLLRPQRPGWSGLMQMVSHGDHPGPSSILFLPMIDMDPSDLTCIYSTLHFVSDHARRYSVTPVITFDQPLWWKAMTIIEIEPDGSQLRSFVLRLGGFHTLMSFLGSIGHLMAGSGIQELLELVFAPNTVPHILSGKAVARAIRGHFLLDSALNTLLLSKAFALKPQTILSADPTSSDISDVSDRPTDHTVTDEGIVIPPELNTAAELLDQLTEGDISSSDIDSSAELKLIKEMIENEINQIDQRTGMLWVMYMKLIDIVREFLRAERTGDWMLHLQAMHDMLPHLAASGHNLYTKSLYIYLQNMSKLQETNPGLYTQFRQGFHIVRRSDRFWAGLSPDLVIEQVLMRSLKTTGGLTRGSGMTETQQLVWCMSRHVCAEVNNAMQQLTSVTYSTSEQHKDLSTSRQRKDMSDTKNLISALEDRDPFKDKLSLQNIITGVEVREDVNTEKSQQIGQQILNDMVGQAVMQYTFKKKKQVITPESKSTIRVNGEMVQIDPQLLFQRLVIAGTQANKLLDAFQFELCSYPPALFETKHVLLNPDKPSLGKAIWAAVSHSEQEHKPSSDNCQYVLDGGALLHRIPWQTGETYDTILKRYTSYVTNHYGKASVIFDGYDGGPSPKDCTHQRRVAHQGRVVSFKPSMSLKLKKAEFLSNEVNKQTFINILSDYLKTAHCTVHHAKCDADLLIVMTAIELAGKHHVVLVGDDTDLLVLLIHHAKNITCEIYWRPEPKKGAVAKYLNIKSARAILGDGVCENILFVHAVLGCDTTSRIFGFGKSAAMKLIQNSECFRTQASVFNSVDSSKEDIIAAGANALLCCYKAKQNDTMDTLRHYKFQELVATSKKVIHPKMLPPTEAAVKYHSLRVYHQVQTWRNVELDPKHWGWKVADGKMIPIMTELEPAPSELLQVVRCKCKAGCGTKRCGCRGLGLDCTSACGECRGICENMRRDDIDDIDSQDSDDIDV